MSQAGYCQLLHVFAKTEPPAIVEALRTFVPDAGDGQIRAWRDSIRHLKTAISELISSGLPIAENCSIILEYTIPLESRRIDAVLLLNGVVLTIEFKGRANPSQANIDQAAAYARDLKAYHMTCSNIPVKCLLVLTRATAMPETRGEVDVIGPDCLFPSFKNAMSLGDLAPDADCFLSLDAYQPLPSLIKAARELFKSGTLKRIHRAATATEPTLTECSAIVHQTAKEKRRALILICGVPGAGKTLVGLQLAHAKYLDDLAVARRNGDKPTAPAVFLSGNGPLVEVLQYELKSAGGDGKAFVRGVHEYVKTFTRTSDSIPPQHVLIYDEAQRAFDAAQVQAKHPDMPEESRGRSEPELFVRFAERVPEWCVVVGLIGSGQEIHIGEEAGLGQWRTAIEQSTSPDKWDIYVPEDPEVQVQFQSARNLHVRNSLQLSTTIRFHLATQLYDFVKSLLDGEPEKAKAISILLEKNGYNLRVTHDLQKAKDYLTCRYDRNPDARFGMVASAKDKALVNHGIPKGFKNPGEVNTGKYGKWYAEPLGVLGSCTGLKAVATEFGAQGLELDACLLAWGTDFIRENGIWTNKYASGYKDAKRIVDAKALRKNAYRVLLTRGRDGCVVFVPPIPDKMRETYAYLRQCGFSELTDGAVENFDKQE